MKKSRKISLLIIGPLVGLVVIFVLLFSIKMNSETKKMAALPTGEVVDNIIAVGEGFVNFYLIKSDSGYLAIDAGSRIKTIQAELKKLGINPEMISAVLLTHSDGDHVSGVPMFENASVYLSKYEKQILDGTTHRFFLIDNKLPCDYLLLNDNQELDLDGIHVRCISTPGHTPGSMSYLINGQFLFVGDLMSLKDGKAELFNKTFNMDEKVQGESLKKVAALPGVQAVFTGHYGYTDDFKRTFESYR